MTYLNCLKLLNLMKLNLPVDEVEKIANTLLNGFYRSVISLHQRQSPKSYMKNIERLTNFLLELPFSSYEKKLFEFSKRRSTNLRKSTNLFNILERTEKEGTVYTLYPYIEQKIIEVTQREPVTDKELKREVLPYVAFLDPSSARIKKVTDENSVSKLSAGSVNFYLRPDIAKSLKNSQGDFYDTWKAEVIDRASNKTDKEYLGRFFTLFEQTPVHHAEQIYTLLWENREQPISLHDISTKTDIRTEKQFRECFKYLERKGLVIGPSSLRQKLRNIQENYKPLEPTSSFVDRTFGKN